MELYGSVNITGYLFLVMIKYSMLFLENGNHMPLGDEVKIIAKNIEK